MWWHRSWWLGRKQTGAEQAAAAKRLRDACATAEAHRWKNTAVLTADLRWLLTRAGL